MQDNTVLLRQVHPNWCKDGHVLSLAFRPFPKDEGQLSVYDGEMIGPEAAWNHFTGELGFQSDGVWGVTVEEVGSIGLLARPDPAPFPEHAVIDFAGCTEKEQKAKSKFLAGLAEARGCLYLPKVG